MCLPVCVWGGCGGSDGDEMGGGGLGGRRVWRGVWTARVQVLKYSPLGGSRRRTQESPALG